MCVSRGYPTIFGVLAGSKRTNEDFHKDRWGSKSREPSWQLSVAETRPYDDEGLPAVPNDEEDAPMQVTPERSHLPNEALMLDTGMKPIVPRGRFRKLETKMAKSGELPSHTYMNKIG